MFLKLRSVNDPCYLQVPQVSSKNPKMWMYCPDYVFFSFYSQRTVPVAMRCGTHFSELGQSGCQDEKLGRCGSESEGAVHSESESRAIRTWKRSTPGLPPVPCEMPITFLSPRRASPLPLVGLGSSCACHTAPAAKPQRDACGRCRQRARRGPGRGGTPNRQLRLWP